MSDRAKIKTTILAMALSTSAFLSTANAADTQSSAARSFDGDWNFKLGESVGAERPDFDDSKWRQLNLPHDWSIEGEYDENAPTGGSGGYLPAGIGWYRKSFSLDESEQGKHVEIRFGGVYQFSTVWINGHELGSQPYGYTEFHYDLTPYLNFGDTPNVISVRVDNSNQPNSRWYSGSGIYRRVWLTATDPIRVSEWGTYITTERASEEKADVRIRVRIQNDRPTQQKAQLINDIVDADGSVVASVEATNLVQSGEEWEFDRPVVVPNPKLWSVESPNLYQVRSKIFVDGNVVDEYVTSIGIRTIEYDTDRGLLVNGEHVKLRGMCLHHDGGSVGAAVPKAVLARRLHLLKEMGCNAIRCSHNPMSSDLYDLCDQLGFLVMDEAFDEWTSRKPQIKYGYSDIFNERHEQDLVSLIHRNRNHPSIVMWSAGNEIGEQWAARGPRVLGKLVEILHREDPTRPVTAAMDNIFNGGGQSPVEFSGLLDIVGYNYVDRWGDRRETHYGDDRYLFPDRKFVGTENRSARGVRGVYEFGPLHGGGYSGGKVQPGFGPDGALYLNDSIDAAELWRFVAVHDYVIGDFAWTGFDYLGEARWPRKLATSGPLDTCGFKKDAFYFYQSIWTDEPMVHALPHWNWADRKGKVVPVVVYSNCEVVELFVNGKSFGAKAREFPRQGADGGWNTYADPVVRSSTTDMQLVWDVPYEAGEVKAVGYKDGVAVVEDLVQTAGKATKLEVSVDRQSIDADGRDVAHVTVRAMDAKGVFVPLASNQLTFEVSGPGRLIGLDSGDPTSHEGYKGTTRKLFSGMALALIQSSDAAGSISLSVEAKGLGKSTVEINSLAVSGN